MERVTITRSVNQFTRKKLIKVVLEMEVGTYIYSK